MKTLLFLLSIFILTACTSLQPIEKSAAELQIQIQENQLLQVGNTIKVYTKNGLTHKFVISEITESKLIGADISVAIEDITALEVRRSSKVKTGFLIGGFVVVASLIAAGIGIKNSELGDGIVF